MFGYFFPLVEMFAQNVPNCKSPMFFLMSIWGNLQFRQFLGNNFSLSLFGGRLFGPLSCSNSQPTNPKSHSAPVGLTNFRFRKLLLMEEILRQLIGSLSGYLQGFIHPRWVAGFRPSKLQPGEPSKTNPEFLKAEYINQNNNIQKKHKVK